MVIRYRQQLAQRLQAAGLEGITIGDERILRELVVFADRSDISEEIARIKGRRSAEIEAVLGYRYTEEVVHRDHLALKEEA